VTAAFEPRFGSLLPDIREYPPGEASLALADRLKSVESRNITHVGTGWPVFWEEARGANVRDVDGNVYIDLTGAFGVALIGHAHPDVTAAVRAQSEVMLHGMGDVHPPSVKVDLQERLCALAPWDDTRVILASTGSEAVEAALKTAQLKTGRPGIVAFEGAYHGLTMGALAVTDRAHFRSPFEERLYKGVVFAPYPGAGSRGKATKASLAAVRAALEAGAPNGDAIGTVIVEPVQGRAGVRVPADGFLAALSELAHEAGVVIIADEIFTGLGRCGATFASERMGLEPDLVCLGKALGGGMPVSACIGSHEVMDAWPASSGEAIHTSTFLGHPLACVAATTVLDVMQRDQIPARVERLGTALLASLRGGLSGTAGVAEVRGVGLMIGIQLTDPHGAPSEGRAVRVAEAALAAGLILLPAGAQGDVVELTPPATLTGDQAAYTVRMLSSLIQEVW
jgi:4-aminobutyrate aminotransferase-like enzyme